MHEDNNCHQAESPAEGTPAPVSTYKPEQSLYLLLNRVMMNLAWAMAFIVGTVALLRVFGVFGGEAARWRLVALNVVTMMILLGVGGLMSVWRNRVLAHEIGWAGVVATMASMGVVGIWLDPNPMRLATALTLIPLTGIFVQRKRMLLIGVGFQLGCIALSFPPLRSESVGMGYFVTALAISTVLGIFIYFMLDALMQRVVTLLDRLVEAWSEIQDLESILPVCGWCKKVRDDDGFWLQVDAYLQRNPRISLTHGICPACKAAFKAENAK